MLVRYSGTRSAISTYQLRRTCGTAGRSAQRDLSLQGLCSGERTERHTYTERKRERYMATSARDRTRGSRRGAGPVLGLTLMRGWNGPPDGRLLPKTDVVDFYFCAKVLEVLLDQSTYKCAAFLPSRPPRGTPALPLSPPSSVPVRRKTKTEPRPKPLLMIEVRRYSSSPPFTQPNV